MTEQLLLKNATVLQHDENDNVVVLRNADILITDGRITEIGKNIDALNDVSIIDCKNKIVSPGFINAHHHMWQTQLKGLLGDCTMLDYMLQGKHPKYPQEKY